MLQQTEQNMVVRFKIYCRRLSSRLSQQTILVSQLGRSLEVIPICSNCSLMLSRSSVCGTSLFQFVDNLVSGNAIDLKK
ncbi:hypothetical protein [Moorena sp. SIO4G3]|uniref:hypothetical protein n=1 Tax=Moorena sp. SIO4G3 TaxID=2607821 RepID=UPI00142BCDFB|nr:hypothetical protein [Moorena sp. SIO4G3]NEO77317.1 hypothetical protein [Moorena sp. SIO4G3]